ncbi:Hypothetical predicted protein, partial [Paramuricea clavata]
IAPRWRLNLVLGRFKAICYKIHSLLSMATIYKCDMFSNKLLNKRDEKVSQNFVCTNLEISSLQGPIVQKYNQWE